MVPPAPLRRQKLFETIKRSLGPPGQEEKQKPQPFAVWHQFQLPESFVAHLRYVTPVEIIPRTLCHWLRRSKGLPKVKTRIITNLLVVHSHLCIQKETCTRRLQPCLHGWRTSRCTFRFFPVAPALPLPSLSSSPSHLPLSLIHI